MSLRIQQIARELAAKNADLVQLNRLKDEFLACISHELRTPLTAVLGLSSLLKDQLSGTMNERQVRYAQLIHLSGRHLMTIVNDILDLTRMEPGQLEITLEPVNIATVCNRAFEQAQQSRLEEAKPEAGQELPAALPTFTLEIEPGLETLIADEMRLRQMLLNLLSNALKFTHADGKIGLRVNLWEGLIAFTVWDTGIGIPAEKQHLIFQKFQQLENPLTRRFEGTGLGLVLTQRLARLHGGDVTFVSKESQGSQFTLPLPPTHPQLAIDPDHESVVFPSVSRSPHNRLVLVVEAVVRSIEHLSEQLSDLGYRVIIARSGTEAVEKARRLQPCTILLNPLLPTLSGWDVLTLLKADPQTRPIPVTVMAGRSSASHSPPCRWFSQLACHQSGTQANA
jgi:nitrogen-specific signal transduction histidine kinase/CheY-like chemotaxis protein